MSFRIAERFLDYGDDDPPEVADGVGYITDVQKCDVTERALLSTKSRQEERPLTKVQQAEHLIGMALRDGGWHLAAPIRLGLPCSSSTTTRPWAPRSGISDGIAPAGGDQEPAMGVAISALLVNFDRRG